MFGIEALKIREKHLRTNGFLGKMQFRNSHRITFDLKSILDKVFPKKQNQF